MFRLFFGRIENSNFFQDLLNLNNTDSQISEYKHSFENQSDLEELSLKQEVITMQNDDNHNGLWTPKESFLKKKYPK